MSDDLTVKILIEIRDAIRTTNERLDATRIELTAEMAEQRSETARVRQEIVAVEPRNATRMVELTAATRSLYDMLADRFDLRDRVERCEREIEILKSRGA